ncbi:MAG: glycosyltransferase family 4 protein [bacterium]|nr:glycosyltransferase family 4 protein [bacterium]
MSAGPRVLVSGVVLGQPMGGVRRHNAELLPRVARILAESGGELCVLEGAEPIDFELPEPIRILRSDVPARPIPLRALRETRALGRALEEARATGAPFDLVHTAHLPAPRHLACPYTITLHDLRSLFGEHTPFSRRFVAKHVVGAAVRSAARVICVSASVRAQLLAGFGLDAEKVAVVPNAADHFTPLPRAAGTDAPIVHLGHIEPRKNLELLVRALAAAPDLPPLELHGAARGEEDERLRGLARELGVGDRVRFAGPYAEEDLPRLLATCACVALPSRIEGFGIVALEAQRAGAPLAISNCPPLVEVAGEDVPRFGADDVDACARALETALAEGEDVAQERARRAGRFRWDASARDWAALLSQDA